MTARFNFMQFMPYIHLPPNHKEYPSLWVNFPNKYYDPHKAAALYERYLDEFEYADKVGFDAIVVNEHHNTTYSHDAGAEPDRGGAAAAREERPHLRVGHAAQSGVSEPSGRGIRHAGRDVGRAARGRFPARHRHGVLGESGQSGDRPRAPQGVDRDHPEGLDAGRSDQPLRRLLHLSLPESLGSPDAAAPSALLHRRHRQPGDDRTRCRTRLRVFGGLRHQETRERTQRQTAPAFGGPTATRSVRTSCRSAS